MQTMPPSARLVGIGFYVAICIVGGTLVGRELDRALDTGRLLTVIGLGVGLSLAIYGAIRQLLDVLEAIRQRRGQ